MVSFILLQKKYAGIAQSVEQLIRNQQVAEHQESWNALKTLCFLETVAAPKTDFVSCLCLIPEKMGCLSLYAGIAQSVERRTRNA